MYEGGKIFENSWKIFLLSLMVGCRMVASEGYGRGR